MKKRLFLLLLMVATLLPASAQRDVTKFLGVPVDGTKTEMIQKLRKKGFTYDSVSDCLTGEFNGSRAQVFVVTNHDKVWRIMVKFADTSSETGIRIAYNKLCQQMIDSEKYSVNSLDSAYTIPSTERIGYELSVHDKRYEASFTQKPESLDTMAMKEDVYKKLLEKYSEEEIKEAFALANEPMPKDSTLWKRTDPLFYWSLYWNFRILEEQRKNSVWFMISESYGSYYILMYYDNEYNHANGEDL